MSGVHWHLIQFKGIISPHGTIFMSQPRENLETVREELLEILRTHSLKGGCGESCKIDASITAIEGTDQETVFVTGDIAYSMHQCSGVEASECRRYVDGEIWPRVAHATENLIRRAGMAAPVPALPPGWGL